MHLRPPSASPRLWPGIESPLSLFSRIFHKRPDAAAAEPLYRAVVRAARDPAWYREGHVPDTIEGRFDMIAALLALVLLRLEREPGDEARRGSVLLTELFIADMEGELRQIGIGDFVVGKHVGRLVGALGGRLGAFRDAGEQFAPAVRHNIFHDAPSSDQAVTFVSLRLRRLRDALERVGADAILRGEVPQP